jgi:S1-C subfamily serine protease
MPRTPLIVYLLPVILLGAIAALLVWKWWPWQGSGLNPNAQPRAVDPRGDYMELEKTNMKVYDTAAPSVVHVTNLAEKSRPFSLNPERVPRATGSGFIWDDDGHIVTNFHVVSGADAVSVTLADHSTYSVQHLWAYKDKDIAVLSVNAPRSKLRRILMGSSHDLKVGQITYAIGNPFGLDRSMTFGIISALGREIQTETGTIHGAIQTSAPINPGNSGGPLLDSAARLIGVNTAIASPSGASAGIGFAIPVDDVNEIVPQLIASGKVTRPRLGVQIAEIQLAKQLGVDQGVLIIKVLPNSPAARAGLRGTSRNDQGEVVRGDVITAIDGKAVNQSPDLFAALEKHRAGDTVTLTILRDNKQQEVQVTLQAVE